MGESAYSFAWILAPSPPNNLFIWFIKVILCIYWIFLIFFLTAFHSSLTHTFAKLIVICFPFQKSNVLLMFLYTQFRCNMPLKITKLTSTPRTDHDFE